jgi:hypothetical protein
MKVDWGMALKPCRECGAQVSTEAEICPHCGVRSPTRPINDLLKADTEGTRKPDNGVRSIVIVVILGVFAFIWQINHDEPRKPDWQVDAEKAEREVKAYEATLPSCKTDYKHAGGITLGGMRWCVRRSMPRVQARTGDWDDHETSKVIWTDQKSSLTSLLIFGPGAHEARSPYFGA